MSMFRKQALDYQCVRMAGTVSLRADRGIWRRAVLFVLAAVAVLAGFACVELDLEVALDCRLADARHAEAVWPLERRLPAVRVTSVRVSADERNYLLPLGYGPVGQPGKSWRLRLEGDAAGSCRASAGVKLSPARLIAARFFRTAT